MGTRNITDNASGESGKGITIWITGLSASGKSTLAASLKVALAEIGISSVLLDADVVRKSINSDLGYSLAEREENNRRAAEIAKIINNSGVIAIGAFISPTDKIREAIKKIISETRFILVYLDTPIEICEKRDVKQLYQKARTGTIKEFSGISSLFEPPSSPDIIIDGLNTVEDNTQLLLSHITRVI
jgi:adenylylsulfate kinase